MVLPSMLWFWPLVWVARTESLLLPQHNTAIDYQCSVRKNNNARRIVPGDVWSPCGWFQRRSCCCGTSTTKRYLTSSFGISSFSQDEQQEHFEDVSETIGVGIDLGTTNSAVAYMENDRPVIISVDHTRTIPSVVAFVKETSDVDVMTSRSVASWNGNLVEGENDVTNNRTIAVLVGRDAAQQDFCYRNVKRIIGTGGNAPPMNVGTVVPGVYRNPQGKTYRKNNMVNRLFDAEHHPTRLQYRVNTNNNNNHSSSTSHNNIHSAYISPEQVSSYILRKLVDAAQVHTGKRVDRAVIGIPAYFDDAQTNATIEAGKLAGIPKVKLMREPEAAALAYQYTQDQTQRNAKKQTNRRKRKNSYDDDNDDDLDELLLAFDLGGGTYDVSVLRRIGGGVTEIICTAGDAQLGGSVWDARLADHLQNSMQQQVKSGIGVIQSTKARSNLVLVAEALRIYLSNHKKAVMRLPKTDAGWCTLQADASVSLDNKNDEMTTSDTVSTTMNRRANKNLLNHVFLESDISSHNNDDESIVITMTRSEMEKVCEAEWLSLLRPLREVAIMAGVMLVGDSRPAAVAAALELEEEETRVMKQQQQERRFSEFYDEDGIYKEDAAITIDNNPLLEAALRQDAKAAKLAQQKGRKKARVVAKKEQRFQKEKRKLAVQITPAEYLANTGVKVRDGIPGRPISRIVLVGGATRMPAIGRLLTQLTGIVPEKTVNPDEAVALGCAVKVGMLDGTTSASPSLLLNPIQAAIVKALAVRDGKDTHDDDDNDYVEYDVDDDDDDDRNDDE